MTHSASETEVKFNVSRLPELRRRAEAAGARLLSERTFETNLRFDTPDGRLRREHRALRLRQDAAVTLTYKGPSQFRDGIRSRLELEIVVQDFERTRELLLALGYIVTFKYEKFRTTLEIAGTHLTLDELPYGHFVEIEGEQGAIRTAAMTLGLQWEAAIANSYHGLFEIARGARKLPFGDLTFDNFRGLAMGPEDLGVVPADI